MSATQPPNNHDCEVMLVPVGTDPDKRFPSYGLIADSHDVTFTPIADIGRVGDINIHVDATFDASNCDHVVDRYAVYSKAGLWTVGNIVDGPYDLGGIGTLTLVAEDVSQPDDDRPSLADYS